MGKIKSGMTICHKLGMLDAKGGNLDSTKNMDGFMVYSEVNTKRVMIAVNICCICIGRPWI